MLSRKWNSLSEEEVQVELSYNRHKFVVTFYSAIGKWLRKIKSGTWKSDPPTGRQKQPSESHAWRDVSVILPGCNSSLISDHC